MCTTCARTPMILSTGRRSNLPLALLQFTAAPRSVRLATCHSALLIVAKPRSAAVALVSTLLNQC